MPLRLLLLAATLTLLTACTQTITPAQLRQKATEISSDQLSTVVYVGRAWPYDYFLTNYQGKASEWRIAVPNDIVKVPMPYNSDQINVGPFVPNRWVP
jgi:hypothetical protein